MSRRARNRRFGGRNSGWSSLGKKRFLGSGSSYPHTVARHIDPLRSYSGRDLSYAPNLEGMLASRIVQTERSYTSPEPCVRALVSRAILFGCLANTSCAVISPRFGSDVQTAVVRDDMRRLETETLVVYYPKGRESEAKRTASRVGYCVRAIRKQAPIHDSWTEQKPRIVLANLPYNNAYVSPPFFSEPISVLPAYNTAPYFGPLNLPPDPGIIGCHEALHYVQLLQAGGFHRFVTSVVGSGYTPQLGLESWFHEGMAVYHETKLLGGIGRLGSRYFEGVLAAGVAGRKINGGWLHYANRAPLHGAHYLVGSFFVDWLVRNYGEPKLWQVVGRQAHALAPPLGVNGRFEAVYGKSLSELLESFAAQLAKRYPDRPRLAGQREGRNVGRQARFIRSPGGWEASIERDLDRPTRLVIHDSTGALRTDRNLTDVMPGRTLIQPTPDGASGLDFSPDHRFLFFTMVDAGPVFQKSRLMRFEIETGALSIAADDLGGPGGGLTPDGKRYVFARAHGDAFGLASLDLATNEATWIRPPEPGVYFYAPSVSPDGERILAIRSDVTGARLSIVDARRGVLLDPPPAPPGPALEASWIDNDRVVFVGESAGRMQVFVSNLAHGTFRQVTQAPYLAFNPQSDGRNVWFLNRERWHWTLDQVALTPEPLRQSREGGASGGDGRWLGVALDRTPKLVIRGSTGESPPRSMAYEQRVAPQMPPVEVISDEPYSQLDGLFVPQVRGPWFRAA